MTKKHRIMTYDHRHLKRISGFTAMHTAKRQGWRAAEDGLGRNHYPVGSARWKAWQAEYDKTIKMIEKDNYEFGTYDPFERDIDYED